MRRSLLVTLALAGCGRESARPRPQAPCDPPAPAPRAFRHTLSGIGAPHHAVNDVVVAVGQPYRVRAKLAYGPTSKDLEDEEVVLVTATGACEWVQDTRVTDDDGWVEFDVPAAPAPGTRTFHVVVPGDGSRISGQVHVIGPATPAVIFDVDGTLTTGDAELLDDLFGEGAEVRAGAAAVASRWAELGRLVIYVTGRPYLLRGTTKRWLIDRGFPSGPLFTVEDLADALPSTAGVGAFKTALVRALLGHGLEVHAAYGNASTDVCAYAEAGIDPARTWITQPREPCAGFGAFNPLLDYEEHLPTITD